ncbi:hypothetical protein FHS22_001386 [Planomonospora venezuelensis]|uniref:Uncharacterized protein n=1 Tax=Planomonospora venezuelensis TaxID=1999 RepID=A0A841D1D4_PLAVE|nr:hypothetical protein [Planomonospora venezuelensis]
MLVITRVRLVWRQAACRYPGKDLPSPVYGLLPALAAIS